VAPSTSVERGHEIAHAVETQLRARYPQVTDVVIHVEPAAPGGSAQGSSS
jgi:divalent metal cation (Fe/Co/Zn/Cd) transporter